jgi:phosphopantothenoylcysteine decarboxylase/phosphopantothenate--cysteine ligase
MKKILIIITGSIASYKSLDLIRLLKKSDYEVSVIMTKAAEEFITPLLVTAITGDKVYQELFSVDDEKKMGHINLSRKNDLIIVAPATADMIAKMTHGIADDLASTVLLASDKPIMIAPAMNEKMWLNKANQKNIQTLQENVIKIIDPETDILACGENGQGKMRNPQEIFDKIDNFFNQKQTFKDKKIIITAGPTYEPIDPVRFIGNYSSGKQGIALAEEFSALGAQTYLIAANIKENISLPKENIIRVKTADQMLQAVQDNLKNTDIFISCAAVADFKPKEISSQKIKKSPEESTKTIELIKNIDILKTISNSDNRPEIVVGFAAESEDLLENAHKKLKEKNCDLIIANNIKEGEVFGSSYNQISIIRKNKTTESFSKMTKNQVAQKIIEFISLK